MTTPEQPPPIDSRRPPLLRSGLMRFGTNVGTAALGLLNVFVVARVLGPAGRGDVAFLTTVGVLVTQVATLGVDQANVNFAGRDERLAPSLATNSLLLASGLGVLIGVTMLVLVAVVPGAGGDVDRALLWLVLGFVPLLIFNVYLASLAAASYGFSVMNAAYLLPPVLNVGVNGTAALAGVLSVAVAVSAWIVGHVLAVVLLVWFLTRRRRGFGRPDAELARRACGFGLRAHAGRIMLLGNYRLDQWILGGVSGSRELGTYSVAVSWSETLFFLPNALANVQRPDLVRMETRGAAGQAAVVFRLVVLVSALLAAALIAFAPFLCVTIFGESFEDSVDELRILALGGFGIGALKLLGSALTAQRRPLLATAAIGVAFVVIVALDIVLIPAYGGEGAAIASTVAYSAGGVAVVLIFARALGARALDLLPRPGDVSWMLGRLRRAMARSAA